MNGLNCADVSLNNINQSIHPSIHGVNSIPELELIILKKVEFELINLELEFPTKKLIQINLPFNFLIQKYFFHDNPTWNINYSE